MEYILQGHTQSHALGVASRMYLECQLKKYDLLWIWHDGPWMDMINKSYFLNFWLKNLASQKFMDFSSGLQSNNYCNTT